MPSAGGVGPVTARRWRTVYGMTLYRAVVKINDGMLGGTGTNTWHLRTLEASPLFEDADYLMEQVRLLYWNRKAAFETSTAINFDGEFNGVGPDSGEHVTGATWGVAGTSSSGHLPPADCICTTWEGEAGDRSKRGRTFFGPISITQNEPANGSIHPGELGAWRTAVDTLVETSDSFDNGAIGIWSRQESLFRDVVTAHISDQFASLRSRRD